MPIYKSLLLKYEVISSTIITASCCRADWHDNAQTGGCHSDPRSLRLSLSPAAKGGRP